MPLHKIFHGDTGKAAKLLPFALNNSDMNFSSMALVSGAEQKIDHYTVTLPTF
jgi:hypothetical protein